MTKHNFRRQRERIIVWFAIGIGSIWGIVTLAAILSGDITILATITPVMLLITGYLVGMKSGNGDKND